MVVPSLTQTGSSPVITGFGNGLIVTVVVQVEILPHASVTVHVIVETPTSNTPLASGPVPLLVVAPVTWYVMVKLLLQLSVALSTGIV